MDLTGMKFHKLTVVSYAGKTNPKNKSYPNYGGRGINIASNWRNSFKAFIDHIGLRPNNTYSIDRINNDIGYIPGNVRWATTHEQSINTRRQKNKNLPVGVTQFNEKFAARRKGIHLGMFNSPEEAHEAYKNYKEKN